MKEILKRMAELNERKVEIRGILESNADADLDTIEGELRSIEDELKTLEKRKKTIEMIGSGFTGARELENPVAARRNGDVGGEAEYRSGWLKQIRRLDVTDGEKRALTTAVNSVGYAVPTVTLNKIVEKVDQFCPILSKIDLLRVPGGVSIPAEGTTTDAAMHTQGATITASADTIVNVSLSAYEITKLVTISKSVEKMSIDAFENWLTSKIARKISEKIGTLIFNGTGSNEAQGINAISWTAENSVTVGASASLTEADVKKLVSLLNGGYDDGAEWYMSKTTFYTDFHPLMNNSKDNLITYESGSYRIMGYPIMLDDRLSLHEAILCNVYRGYAGNMPEDITITSQFVTRENAYDFLGCAMFDGKVQAKEAFVKLKKAAA